MDLEYLGDELIFDFNSSSIFSYVENKYIIYDIKAKGHEEVPIVIINELLNRYCFIHDNAEIIIGQLIYEAMINDMNIWKRLSDNTNIRIDANNIALEKKTNLFCLLEEFLIGDISFEETEFYKKICEIRDNEWLFSYTKKQFANEDVRDFNMRVVLELASFMIEQQKGSYIWKKADDGTHERVYDHEGFVKTVTTSDVRNKLKSLLPYFDILFYQNKEDGRWDCKRRVWSDRRDEFEVNYTLVDGNCFNKCFSDYCYSYSDLVSKYFENSYRLPEKVLQRIYCRYHDELPWNMKVKCSGDNSFIRPDNTKCCGEEFFVREEDLFCIEDGVYQLCGNCGYIVKVDVKDKIKDRVKKRCSEDSNLLRKKMILSELTSLSHDNDVKLLVKRREGS